MEKLKTYKSFLVQNCSTKPVALFRIVFGALMAYYCLRYRNETLIYTRFLDADFLFSYPLMEWLNFKVLPMKQLFLLHKVMFVSAVCIALGLFYRSALLIFGLTFTYGFLLDKTYYNNHYYFICLVSFLMIFVPANARWSMDVFFKFRPFQKQMENWRLLLLQAQVCIVYLFGGITKLDPDWVNMSVARTTFETYPEWGVFLVTFGGLFGDFLLAFLIFLPQFRLFLIFLGLIFHFLVKVLINVGIFPFLMMGAFFLFIPFKDDLTEEKKPLKRSAFFLIHLYLIIQLLMPFHHFLYPGHVSWTKEGDRWSWRMFSQKDAGHLDVFVTDSRTNETIKVPRLKGLTMLGYFEMVTYPKMIWQYVQYLKEYYQAQGVHDPIIQVDSFAALNGRNFARLIDRDVDLAKEKYPFYKSPSWILPHPDKQITTEIPWTGGGAFLEPAYQLAVIDAERLLPGEAKLHQDFKAELKRLVEKYKMPPQEIADRIVEARMDMWESGGPLLTIEEIFKFMRSVDVASFDFLLRRLKKEHVLMH